MIRIEKGYSQDFVADKLGVSQPCYSMTEKNAEKTSYSTLKKIAFILGVSVLFLLDIDSSSYIEFHR